MPPANTARQRLLAQAAQVFVTVIAAAAQAYAGPLFDRTPYHTSILTGEAWVQELIHGHPDRIKTELGMRLHVFIAFVSELRACGLADSRHVTLEEQVSIFLYTSVTGLSIRHVGERFQHANDTISR